VGKWPACTTARSLAQAVHSSVGPPDAVRHLLLGLRDVRDRTARRSVLWREAGVLALPVAIAWRWPWSRTRAWMSTRSKRCCADGPDVVVKTLEQVAAPIRPVHKSRAVPGDCGMVAEVDQSGGLDRSRGGALVRMG
jgi:hypothetical protein